MKSIKLPSWTEKLLGLDPVPAPPHVFGLSGNELSYGSFRRGPQGYVFDAASRVALDRETFASGPLGGPLRSTARFEEQLKAFVAGLPGEIHEASLVLPDTWMRLTFTEVAELPRKREAQIDVLRFKLKRLVPFRVEELRISAVALEPLADQEEPVRLLLGFAIDLLINQLEDAFAAFGVTIGQITNESLALMAALEDAVAADQLAAQVLVRPEAYTLSFFCAGEPLLYRYKPFTDEMPDAVRMRSVRRELRMTNSFLHENFAETPLSRVFLNAPAGQEDLWMTWIYEELDASPELIEHGHFPLLVRWQAEASWMDSAPLFGAVRLEVT